jgi:hypothetical protein
VFEDGKWKSVYNPTAPIAAIQMARDIVPALMDAAVKGEKYKKYIEDSGGMEFLTLQGRLFQRGKHLRRPVVDPLMNFAGYLGHTTELGTRLANRDRVIRRRAREMGISYESAAKMDKVSKEATFAARDYLDFGQGGRMVKAADNAIPYLNASVQGTRGLFRAFKPGSGTALVSAYKMAQFAGLVAGLTIAAQKLSPKSYAEGYGSSDNMNNIVIPLGDDVYVTDDEGQKRYFGIKVPIDPSQKFFKTLFEGITNKSMGKRVDVDNIVESLKQLSPADFTALPPTMSALIGYVTNKDFWLNEDIWRGQDGALSWPRSKHEVRPGQTPQVFTDIGEMTGLSPERLNYAVDELTANDTVWSYLGNVMYSSVRGGDKYQRKQAAGIALAKLPMVKRFVSVTHPYPKYKAPLGKIKEDDIVERLIQNTEMDQLIYKYKNGEGSVSDITKYIAEQKDPWARNRLLDKYVVETRMDMLSEKSFWKSIADESAKVKARAIVYKLSNSDDEEKAAVLKDMGVVQAAKGLMSDQFMSEFSKLINERGIEL